LPKDRWINLGNGLSARNGEIRFEETRVKLSEGTQIAIEKSKIFWESTPGFAQSGSTKAVIASPPTPLQAHAVEGIPVFQDTVECVAVYAALAIRKKIVNYFQSGNFSPMIGDIHVNEQCPLKIQLSTEKDGTLDLSCTINSFTISGKANMIDELGCTLVPKTTWTRGPGSKDDNVWHSAEDTAAEIKSGTISCAGSFEIGGKIFSFTNGSVVFVDLVKTGTFSEGTTVIYNGKTYCYFSGVWKKAVLPKIKFNK